MTTEVAEILAKIQQYIQQTGMECTIKRYGMRLNELFAMLRMDDTGMALTIAYDYGRAKGYRAARAEMKRKQQRRERSA